MDVKIDEIVGFLHKVKPDRLVSLRAKYPSREAAILLTNGLPLGNEAPDVAIRLQQVKCEAAIAALDEVLPESEEALRSAKSRLARANTWESAGIAFGAMGTAGAAVLPFLLPGESSSHYVSVSAMIGLAGNLAALSQKHLRKTLYGVQDGLMKNYVALLDARSRSRLLLPILHYSLTDTDLLGATEVMQAIAEANELVRNLRQLTGELGT